MESATRATTRLVRIEYTPNVESLAVSAAGGRASLARSGVQRGETIRQNIFRLHYTLTNPDND